MEASVCTSCRRPKAGFECEVCKSLVCKKCAQILKKDSFSFLDPLPAELSHKTYCGACFDEKVGPELASYQQTMARARGVFVFQKTQREETRLMRRSEKPLQVKDCPDRGEALLRLAFFAARAGFNALIDVEITSKKLRNEGYQTSRWSGTGMPTRVDAEKLNREEKLTRLFLAPQSLDNLN